MGVVCPAPSSSENPYPHWQTEHFPFTRGLSPLSPINDMIGDQATRGLYVLVGLEHVDHQDALTCALLGWMFIHQPEKLAHPCRGVDPLEGWIFVPEDGLG